VDTVTPSGSSTASRIRKRHLILILIIVSTAVFLRCSAVGMANMWIDELWTLELSTGRGTAHEHLPLNTVMQTPEDITSLKGAKPIWTVWNSIDEATHPPLFFIILRVWREIFGDGDLAARSLPCIFSLLALALLFFAVLDQHGPTPALWAAALMAVASPQILYAQEIRGYSLMMVLGIAAIIITLRIERHGASLARAALLSALLLFMMLTHYFTAGAVCGLGAYVLIRFRGRDRIRTIAAFVVAGVLFGLVWGPFFWRQRAAFAPDQVNLGYVADFGRDHSTHLLRSLAMIPGAFITMGGGWTAAAAMAALAVPLFFRATRRSLLIWYCWLLGTIGFLLLIDLTRQTRTISYVKYTVLASPALYAIIAAGLEPLGKWWRHAVPAAMVAASLYALPDLIGVLDQKTDWKPVAAAVSASARPGDVIILSREPGKTGRLYLYLCRYLNVSEHPMLLLETPATPATLQKLSTYERIWLLRDRAARDPSELLPGAVLSAPDDLGDVLLQKVQFPSPGNSQGGGENSNASGANQR
jgi:mannosyltransferase